MLRLGLVDCDTSHAYQFARRINHIGIEEEQWVDGAHVVAAVRGSSRITAATRIDEYIAAVEDAGVELIEHPEDLIGRIDAVLIESNEGAVHLERALPFIRAGLPVFVDKPLATSARDATTLVEEATRLEVPLISASSLRFAREVRAAKADPSIGNLLGADVHSPATLHEANPGLFHYGIHGVEMLYALLGPGCLDVSCTFTEGSEVTIGRWRDGRIGTIRGLRTPTVGYGFTAFGESGISAARVGTEWIYHDLLEVVIAVLGGAASPISGAELIEVVSFQESALKSIAIGGGRVTLPVA